MIVAGLGKVEKREREFLATACVLVNEGCGYASQKRLRMNVRVGFRLGGRRKKSRSIGKWKRRAKRGILSVSSSFFGICVV